MLSFQISITDNFGSVISFNLKEDGDKIPVTMQNRQVNTFKSRIKLQKKLLNSNSF